MRRTITIFSIPDHVIEFINNRGKSHKTAGFKNKLEFWDRMKNIYNWENEDLDVSDGEVEIKPMNVYPHIPAEILRVLLKSDLQPNECDVQANPIPTMSYLAAASWTNSSLVPTP